MTDEHARLVCSLEDAVELIEPGMRVGIGGMMLYRRPVAFCRALAEQGVNGLELVTFSAGFETELLVEAGCVARIRTCYTGLEGFGGAPRIRRAVEAGEIELVDETELTLAAGLQARALGLPWLPSTHGVLGTDLVRARDDLAVFRDPVGGELELLAMPSITLDICVIHASEADSLGNCALASSLCLDLLMAAAATATIVTAEVVRDDTLESGRHPCDLPGFEVDRLVLCPGGARPTSCHPHYSYDGAALLDYLERVDG